MEQALAQDAKNGNSLLADAISKELENVKEAFENSPDGKKAPIYHQFVQCHMVFNNKMESFRQKERLMAGCHMTEALATIKYASDVSRETVRIVLMIPTLNDVELSLVTS